MFFLCDLHESSSTLLFNYNDNYIKIVIVS